MLNSEALLILGPFDLGEHLRFQEIKKIDILAYVAFFRLVFMLAIPTFHSSNLCLNCTFRE